MDADRHSHAVPAWGPLRWPVKISAELREMRSCALGVTMLDISATGCRVFAGFRAVAGRPARIAVPGFEPFEVTIVWSREWEIGLRFARPLHMSVVRHIAALGAQEALGPGDGAAWIEAGCGSWQRVCRR